MKWGNELMKFSPQNIITTKGGNDTIWLTPATRFLKKNMAFCPAICVTPQHTEAETKLISGLRQKKI